MNTERTLVTFTRFARAHACLWLLALCTATTACSKKTDEAKQKTEAKPAPAAAARPVQPQAEKPAPKPWVGERTIDPEKVPVEEDFATDAEWRITQRTNLESELDRLEQEIVAAGQRGGIAKTSP
jgi:hypothetical protein